MSKGPRPTNAGVTSGVKDVVSATKHILRTEMPAIVRKPQLNATFFYQKNAHI